MGNGNSSRWQGHHKKTCVEDCLRLPVSRIIEFSNLEPGILSWSRNGKKIGSISVTRQSEHALVLEYIIGKIYFYSDIKLNTTSLPWDAVRYWFTCPNCGRRVRDLYVPPSSHYFACRHCHDLTYRSSQRENIYSRVLNRLDKILRC
jgi:hypothetical protein